MSSSSPQARLLRAGIEHVLQDLLASLPDGWPDQPLTVQVNRGEVKALLQIGKLSDEPPALDIETHGIALSPVQTDVLMVVESECQRRGRRVTGAEVRMAVKAAGRHWCATSVNTALADLVASRILNNRRPSHSGPGGYAPNEVLDG